MSRAGRCLPLSPVMVALLALCGCGVEPGVFASVGGHDLSIGGLQEYLAAVTGSDWQDVDGVVATRLMDQYLDQEVVAAAAARSGDASLPVEPGARAATVRSLLGSLCGAPPAPDPAELIVEVERRMAVTRPPRAHVRQMLLEDLEGAQETRQRLEDGEDFVELSKAVSRTPNAEGGGEIGFIAQGTLPEELDEVIFALAEGEISQPVEGPTGYHIFQVLERVGEGPPRRQDVERAVRREMSEVAAKGFTRVCVARLAGEVGVAVHGDHLWFEYGGRYGEDNS